MSGLLVPTLLPGMGKEQSVGLVVSLKEMHPRVIASHCFLWE